MGIATNIKIAKITTIIIIIVKALTILLKNKNNIINLKLKL